jgi:hypothetical protein
VLGGAITVIAGLIAAHFGGLFLAFPAIFPASATLIEKHARERKRKAGLRGTRRGKERPRSTPPGLRSEVSAGGFRSRHLANDRGISRVGPRPRGSRVARRRDARMAGAATAVEG